MSALVVLMAVTVAVVAVGMTVEGLRRPPVEIGAAVAGFSESVGVAFADEGPSRRSAIRSMTENIGGDVRDFMLGRAEDLAITDTDAATALETTVSHLLIAVGIWLGWIALGAVSGTGSALEAVGGLVVIPAIVVAWKRFRLSRVADGRRAEFRVALAGFLETSTVLLTAGKGIHEAVETASSGSHWAWRQIRGSMDAARLKRTSPWEQLGALGKSIGVGEAVRAAQTLTLATQQGHGVAEGLAKQAERGRAAMGATVEERALKASESMRLPMMLMLLPLLAFIFAPIIQLVEAISSGNMF